ncbi:MAG: GLUG motif-containing protein [Hominilimicola sp.]
MKQTRTKAASFLTAIVIAFNLLPVGMVSAEDTVVISSVNDFKNFTEKCVYDEYSKNKTFVLQNDLDLSGVEVKNAEVFCGTFEGGGHNITNLKLSFSGSDKGLFSSVTKDAQIKDLYVTGDIKVTDSADTESTLRRRAVSILNKTDLKSEETEDDGAKAAGGIAGYNAGKIINCSFAGTISGKKQVGGIVGYNAMTGVIDSCANSARVDGESETGGLAGYNEGRIKLSKNTGAICPEADENTTDIGGISGNNEGALVICTNDGAVGGESFGDNVGGISGKQSGEIRECVNNGEVKGRRSVGGITGRFEPYTDIELSYESAKAAVKKQADILKDDLETAKQKIEDYFEDFFGIDMSDANSRLDRLNDSAVHFMDSISNSSSDMMDSIKDAVNKASDSNLLDTVRDAVEKGSDNTTELKDSMKDVSDSLQTTLDEVDDFLNEFDGKGQEISDTLDELNDAIDKGEGDVDEIKDKLFDQMDSMEEDIDDLTDKLDETHTSLNRLIRNMNNVSGEAADLLYDLDRIVVNSSSELKKLRASLEKMADAIEKLVGSMGDIIETIKPIISLIPTMAPSETVPPYYPDITPLPENTEEPPSEDGGYEAVPDENLESGYDVVPSIVGMIKDMLFTTAYAKDDKDDDEEKTAISDLKSTDISLPRLIGDENADTALIKYSINNGNVEGIEMSGGIAGSTGFESTVRNGENVILPDGTKVDSDSVLKAVIDSCISYGNITAKTKYAGGICGKSDIGNIKNSLTTGEIEVTDGNYAGGTAGMSGGDITNCIAINDVSGDKYIGGIAGHGKDIKTSYALSRLDAKSDKAGAVAGFITGTVETCYFIDEGLSGISGANLEGKADAVKPSEIATSDGSFPGRMPGIASEDFYMASGDLYMPQINALANNSAENIGALLQSKSEEMAKFHFNVRFMDKDKELKSMMVDYGTVLDDRDIPRLTADGTDVPAWDKDVHSPIIRHTTFTAEYNKATTTLSTGETPALLLVESVFDEETTVSVREEDVEHEFDGYKKGKAYSFTLNKNAYDVIKVHVRDEKKKAAKIAVQENGKWTELDCTVDGSYAVFQVGAPCEFVILYKKIPAAVPVLICGGAAVLLGAGLVLLKRVRMKYGRKKEKDI